MAAQDLDEPFDLCDRDGRSLGRVKARRDVHRDGDWHRALHLWVIVPGASGPRVVLQRRSLAKDTHPGRVDVSVAGHLRAGESVDEALRESDEEIGLAVSPSEVVRLGERRVERVVRAGVDREVQTVLAVSTARAFATLRPHPDEVAALYAVDIAEAHAWLRGAAPSVLAERLDAAGLTHGDRLVEGDLIPGDEAYRAACVERLVAHLRGERFAPLTLDQRDSS
jgi:isopentenyldiphosphate isomerase